MNMPTGFPKDPVAYAAKQAVRREERAVARAANGEPPKRTTTRRSNSRRKTPTGPKELAVVRMSQDLADADDRLAETSALVTKFQNQIGECLAELNDLRQQHDQTLAKGVGLVRRAEKAESRMNAVLDLVTKTFV